MTLSQGDLPGGGEWTHAKVPPFVISTLTAMGVLEFQCHACLKYML